MKLMDNMLAHYIDIIERYIKHWPIRFGAEKALRDAKHASASQFVLALKDFVRACQDPSSEAGTIEEFSSASPEIVVPLATTNVCLDSPIDKAPPSVASSRSSAKRHSLLYFELKKAATKPPQSPAVASVVSAAEASEANISEYRRTNNMSRNSFEFRHINNFEILSDLFIQEKTKIKDLRCVANNHPEGSYDALLALIIHNINMVSAISYELVQCLEAGLGSDYLDLEVVIDKHRVALLFFITEFNCTAEYDKQLFDYPKFRGQKELYALNGKAAAVKSALKPVKKELDLIAQHIFDSGYVAEQQYIKTMADYLSVKAQLQKLSGVSPKLMAAIGANMQELVDSFAQNFAVNYQGVALAELALKHKKMYIEMHKDEHKPKKVKKPFVLDGEYDGTESPFAAPPRPTFTPVY